MTTESATPAPPRREVKPPNHLRRNLVLGGVTVAAVAAGAYTLWEHRRASVPVARFELADVDRGAIRAKITATGIVNPIVSVQVGTQVSGTIEKLGADFNSIVTPGQMIAEIDPRLFRAAVEQAAANLLAADASTNKARATLVDATRTAARNARDDRDVHRGRVSQSGISRRDQASAQLASGRAERRHV